MNPTIRKLLGGEVENRMLPFFWQHGEDETTLRDYMRAIRDTNCGAVCVESRPHPDFCGPLWWRDMDIILDEAKNRGMKVWILDDSHFPSGYANGALKTAPAELCRQSIYCQKVSTCGGERIKINVEKYIHPRFKPSPIERFMLKPMRKFDDDRLLSVVAIRTDGHEQPTDLTGEVSGGRLDWKAPSGQWNIWLCCLTRNLGPHREYINMLDRESCRLFIDSVYEPHLLHYGEEFGKTIAGFFSDEPELGNFHLWQGNNLFGTDQDLPWGRAMPAELSKRIGEEWPRLIPLLWENGAKEGLTARVRYAYMDSVTRLVESNFSWQIGDWCRSHGTQYIGHVIEDNNQHARTGASLGHFFRGLSGQDMAGIDVIANQVMPQAEDQTEKPERDSEFYHYALGRLGSSLAAIDPIKGGRAFCEIFGNYGWGAGVQLQKYLADHFMVRGINYFVPHAFNPRKFPDPDCPPHFYAGGHDAQIRHFGRLMLYMNRICNLTSGGSRPTPVAILYHAEAEWTGKAMLMQKPARILEEHQIDFDFIPADVFADTERYRTRIGEGLKVNTQDYKVLLVPAAQFITGTTATAIARLRAAGFPVAFLESLPEGVCDGGQDLLAEVRRCSVVPLSGLLAYLGSIPFPRVVPEPASDRLRVLHYRHGNDIFLLVNEGATAYNGVVRLPSQGGCYSYDAWDNRLERLAATADSECTRVSISIQPRHSSIVVFDSIDDSSLSDPVEPCGPPVVLHEAWRRSCCRGIDYPHFGRAKAVRIPDDLAREKPWFSGYARYENSFKAGKDERIALSINDAAEGVEVFVNGVSVGLQIVPPYVFDLSPHLREGTNDIAVEVASCLARQASLYPMVRLVSRFANDNPPSRSGLTGEIKLYRLGKETRM
jgi:hypothetical protein